MYNENEILMRMWENTREQLTVGAAGASDSVSASLNTENYEKFKNANRVCYQISAAISANRAGIDATFDNTTWFRLLSVSGLGVVSGYSDCPYRDYRGFGDTWSSGTIAFDFIQNK